MAAEHPGRLFRKPFSDVSARRFQVGFRSRVSASGRLSWPHGAGPGAHDEEPPLKRGPLLFVAGVAVGLVIGFGAGVMSVQKARDAFVGAFATERSADVDHPRDIVRPAFQLKYPGNWKIDIGDSGYDPDHHFSIDSSGQSFVMFSVADGDIAPKVAVEAVVTAMTKKVMRDATRTPFDHWGAYEGEGVVLTGKNLGITRATVRVFSFRAGDRTVTVTESTFNEDRAMVAPGFALVERSFRASAASGQ
jgi:hypothetical protein